MFRELKFESDADVGQTETFYKGLDIIYPYVGGLPFRSNPPSHVICSINWPSAWQIKTISLQNSPKESLTP